MTHNLIALHAISRPSRKFCDASDKVIDNNNHTIYVVLSFKKYGNHTYSVIR